MDHSQKYCLVFFISPTVVGTEFAMTEWPLHVTLADVFAVDLRGTDIEAKLAALIAKLPSFSVTADKEAVLGKTRVVLLHKSTALMELHNYLMDLLEANGAVCNTPQFTREGFKPHCTIHKTARLHTGDELNIDSIALVDMFPAGNWQRRKVIDLFTLRKT